MIVTNVYKPPNEKWKTIPMNFCEHVYDDMAWGHEKMMKTKDPLYEWLATVNLELVYSIKDSKMA